MIAGQVTLGFQAARSHRLVAVERCEILSADIAAALPGLRQLAGLLLSEDGRKKKSDVRISVNDKEGAGRRRNRHRAKPHHRRVRTHDQRVIQAEPRKLW